MVRRPRASTLGASKGPVFVKIVVGKWQKMKRKMLLPGHDAAREGASRERIVLKFDN